MALLIPFFILAAFFLLRANPQRRRAQAQRTLLESLGPGAHVVTVAGVIGTVVAIEGDRAAIEVAPGVIVEFLLAAIVRTLEEPSDEAEAAFDSSDPTPPGDAPDSRDPQAPRHEET